MTKDKKSLRFHDQVEGFFKWPIFYFIGIIGTLFIAFVARPKEWLVYAVVLALYLVMTVYLVFFYRRKIMNEIVQFALKLQGNQEDMLNEFELPYVLLDPMGRVTWFNNAFTRVTESGKIINMKISSLIPSLPLNLFPLESDVFDKNVQIGNKMYKVHFKKIVIEALQEANEHKAAQDEIMFAAYFFDISRQVQLQTLNDEQEAVFGLLYVDNYEEVIHSVEDVRRPLLVALIDRNINKLGKDIDGIIRKFEKDKYFIVFRNKHMEGLKNNKFAILDSIREIDIGNEMAVTISIGIGTTTASYIEKFDAARTAMDLALGRGGDQAVVKNDEKLSFYGGKTRGVEKSTRVKARIKAHAFKELMLESSRVLIMGHKLADMDSLGAALGVFASAKHVGKNAHIVLNKVTTTIGYLHEQLMDDHDYPEDLFITNQQAHNLMNDQVLLVVVDVNRPSYTEDIELLRMAKKVVVFDHHRVTSEYIENAVLSYVEPYASSTCEMITEMIQYISDRFKLKAIEADALFAGITVDTKNFVAKTGVKTFEAAAYLRRNGADAVRVSKFFKNDMASYKARATAVKDAEIFRDNMAISICPSDTVNPNLVGAQAADELLNIAGIHASFVLTQVGGIIYISARSMDDINVQLIMEKLGGGGHMNVAGAQLENTTVESAIHQLKNQINSYFEKGDKL